MATRRSGSKPKGRGPKNAKPAADPVDELADDAPPAPAKAKPKGRRPSGRTTASQSKVGRYKSPVESGRYTPPIPKSVRRSPVWYGVLVLVFLLGGLATILLNYMTVLPGSQSPWYLVGGLVVIFAGFLMATRYR